jgi:hypothetical protein
VTAVLPPAAAAAVPAPLPMTLVVPSIVKDCEKVAPEPLLPSMVIDVAAIDFTVPVEVFVSVATPPPEAPTLETARIRDALSVPPMSW